MGVVVVEGLLRSVMRKDLKVVHGVVGMLPKHSGSRLPAAKGRTTEGLNTGQTTLRRPDG